MLHFPRLDMKFRPKMYNYFQKAHNMIIRSFCMAECVGFILQKRNLVALFFSFYMNVHNESINIQMYPLLILFNKPVNGVWWCHDENDIFHPAWDEQIFLADNVDFTQMTHSTRKGRDIGRIVSDHRYVHMSWTTTSGVTTQKHLCTFNAFIGWVLFVDCVSFALTVLEMLEENIRVSYIPILLNTVLCFLIDWY